MGASVTLWEATAPVKLPTRRGPWSPRLGSELHKSGISPAPPQPPQGLLHRLPPILRMRSPEPASSCSKAPRGLFVLSRVTRIFTGASISPGPSSRQRPDRYAFRAGRNLPDKEFRYLRTVIVTAAVYRGFGSKLSLLPLTFRHWAGISPHTSSYLFAGTCVFVKQSPGLFLCGSCERPFSRTYGAILPSSLTKGIPFTSVFSTCPPVSVCGTVNTYTRLEAFLGGLGVRAELRVNSLPITPR